MRKTIAAVLAASLAGCNPQLVPLGPPSTTDIAAEMAANGAISSARVQEFYTTGTYLVQDRCGGFYNDAVMASIKNAQTAGEASLLIGLVTGVLGLAGVSGAGVGGAGLGGTFISGLLLNQESNSLAGLDPAGSYAGTVAEQAALINATPTPITVADAKAAINNLARACSPAGIKAMQEQAMHAIPQNIVTVGGQTPAPAPAAGLRVGRPVFGAPVSRPTTAPPYVHVGR